MTVLGLAFLVVPAAIGQGQQIVAKLPALIGSTRTWAETLRPAVLSTSVRELLDSVSKFVAPSGPPKPEQVVGIGTAAAEAAMTVATSPDTGLLLACRARATAALHPRVRPAGSTGRARDAWNEVESRLGLLGARPAHPDGHDGSGDGRRLHSSACRVPCSSGSSRPWPKPILDVGPLLGAIPAILVAATVSPQWALIVAGVYVIIQLVEGSVLVPLVMRNTIGISPLLVLLALLVGGAVGGLVGAFLAVPIAASVEIVLSRLQARETPVALDAAAIETPDEEARDALERSLPDASGSSAA